MYPHHILYYKKNHFFLIIPTRVSITKLYMYCKTVHGELAYEIVEEFVWQYVRFPFDDGKVPHVHA